METIAAPLVEVGQALIIDGRPVLVDRVSVDPPLRLVAVYWHDPNIEGVAGVAVYDWCDPVTCR